MRVSIDSGQQLPSELSSFVAWQDKYVVASADQSHLLVVNAATGKLASVVGNPGRGPGELNSVARLTAVGEEYLLVAQEGGDDLLFNKQLQYVATLPKGLRCGYPVGTAHIMCFKRSVRSGEKPFALLHLDSLRGNAFGPPLDTAYRDRAASCPLCEASLVAGSSDSEMSNPTVTLAASTHRLLQRWRLDGSSSAAIHYLLPSSMRNDSLRTARADAYPLQTRTYGGWQDDEGGYWLVLSAKSRESSVKLATQGGEPVPGALETMTSGRESIIAAYDSVGHFLAELVFPGTIVMPLSEGRVVARNYSPEGFVEYQIIAVSLLKKVDQ